ncbi:polysaccharide deacetylase family protein [Chitiniphilus purpureus]|uniref:Polysaccharide deacetylase family protein n=1 Tax=Chitiniphilus purpureus TaxID=2981137 RepID=A0ABY6DYC7_9NEIS|nr:polysaccharide deacetylase family protein [Chitiniphilus sp. CD1]UXY16843.1 polysaccharide deacetylase family protein [Chitiniphilus sp. CD1]
MHFDLRLKLVGLGMLLCGAVHATPLAECLGFSANDTVLIVNPDDVGMHRDLDKAAFELLDEALIQDLSVMAPAPNFAGAAREATARGLKVGVHLTLTNEWQQALPWGGVLPAAEVPSLYNPQGRLWATTREVAKHAKPDEVRRELRAQIAKVRAAGLQISHLDAHMMFWAADRTLFEIYVSLGEETGIPVLMQSGFLPLAQQLEVNRKPQAAGLATPDTFSMLYDPPQRQHGVPYRGYETLLAQLPPGVHALAIHPGTDSAETRHAIADLPLRLSDFAVWRQGALQRQIAGRGIKTSSYAPLHALQQQLHASPKAHCLQRRP